MSTDRRLLRQHGLTLIELIMFIVIVSVAVVGILSVMNLTTGRSADPMIQKQALAIAESLLEEIELQPFTFCFPTDDKAITATKTADCTSGVSEDDLPSSARVSNTGARDALNVADYNNFTMSGIRKMNDGESIPQLSGYSANVAISQVGDNFSLPEKNDVLQIDVTVTPPGGEKIKLTGYRFRYAPRAVP